MDSSKNYRRSRSRSRDRDQRKDRDQQGGGRDHTRERDRERDRIPDRDRDRDRERFDDDRHTDRYSNVPTKHSSPNTKSVKLTKAEMEAKKKERLELVKRMKGGDPDEEEAAALAATTFRVKTTTGEEGDEEEELQADEDEMNRLLGFGGFGSTKGKQVIDNAEGAAAGAAAKHKERKYRQYMNRKGGFNRPLSKMP